MTQNSFTIYPIGTLRAKQGSFRLEIAPQWWPALAGLEGFSHLNVLWWSHLADDAASRKITTAEAPYRDAPSSLGIFATRSPMRPNPISLSVAAITAIDLAKGFIELDYLDAEDETPIIDLKPYYPCSEIVTQASTPAWSAAWPKNREEAARFDWSKVFINAC